MAPPFLKKCPDILIRHPVAQSNQGIKNNIFYNCRHVMDGSLPNSLKHIISNAEYYGPSLFLLATDVVTNYVFQEPSLLSSLQDNGLTDVVLHALLVRFYVKEKKYI